MKQYVKSEVSFYMEKQTKNMGQVLKDVLHSSTNSLKLHRLIGIQNNDVEAYAEIIYEFLDEIKAQQIPHHFFQKGIDVDVSKEHADNMSRYWTTVTKLKEPLTKTIVDVTFGYRKSVLLSKEFDTLVSQALVQTVNLFRENQKSLDILKNFYFSLTYWIEHYLPRFVSAERKEWTHKLMIYWGDVKRNEAYFLYFLAVLGIEVVYINPASEDGTAKVNRIKEVSHTYVYDGKQPLPELPKRIARTKTVAAQAQKEIHAVLHTDSTGIYKPWQFEQYQTEAVSLQTTMEELFILWKEPAKFRTGFEVKNKAVQIPNIFAKVSGVPSETSKFWDEFNALKQVDNAVVYDKLPMMSTVPFHHQNIVLKNGKFQAEDIKKMKEYAYHHLRSSVQDTLIGAINDLIADEDLLVDKGSERNFPYIVLHTVLNMDPRLIALLQTFDYADQIPKLIILDLDQSMPSLFDAVVVAILHKIGFDIVLLTPTGYQNIEQFIDNRFFDHHKRERFVFDLTLEESRNKKSWFGKLFE